MHKQYTHILYKKTTLSQNLHLTKKKKKKVSETQTAASQDLGEKDEYRNDDCHLSGHAPLLDTDLFTITTSVLLQLNN